MKFCYFLGTWVLPRLPVRGRKYYTYWFPLYSDRKSWYLRIKKHYLCELWLLQKTVMLCVGAVNLCWVFSVSILLMFIFVNFYDYRTSILGILLLFTTPAIQSKMTVGPSMLVSDIINVDKEELKRQSFSVCRISLPCYFSYVEKVLSNNKRYALKILCFERIINIFLFRDVSKVSEYLDISICIFA